MSAGRNPAGLHTAERMQCIALPVFGAGKAPAVSAGPPVLYNHGGEVMYKPVAVHYLWVGSWTDGQKAVVKEFTSAVSTKDTLATGERSSRHASGSEGQTTCRAHSYCIAWPRHSVAICMHAVVGYQSEHLPQVHPANAMSPVHLPHPSFPVPPLFPPSSAQAVGHQHLIVVWNPVWIPTTVKSTVWIPTTTQARRVAMPHAPGTAQSAHAANSMCQSTHLNRHSPVPLFFPSSSPQVVGHQHAVHRQVRAQRDCCSGERQGGLLQKCPLPVRGRGGCSRIRSHNFWETSC